MERHLILLLLFERGLTAVFLVGGLRVVDEQNGLRESRFLLQLLFVWLDQRRSMPMKSKNSFLTGIKNSSYFSAVPLRFFKETSTPYLQIPAVCVNMLCLRWNLTLNCSVCTSRLCKICSNTAFRLRDNDSDVEEITATTGRTVKMGENITEIGQWIYRKQGSGEDQADGELKIIGRCINIYWTQSV